MCRLYNARKIIVLLHSVYKIYNQPVIEKYAVVVIVLWKRNLESGELNSPSLIRIGIIIIIIISSSPLSSLPSPATPSWVCQCVLPLQGERFAPGHLLRIIITSPVHGRQSNFKGQDENISARLNRGSG